MEKIKNENKICYLVGDYNINLINVDSHTLTSEFNDIMYSGGFIPLITRPTRVNHTSATLIDNIYSNQILDRDHSVNGIIMTDISDLYPIFHIANYDQAQDVKYIITRRNYTTKIKTVICHNCQTLIGKMFYSRIPHRGRFLCSTIN